MNDEIPDGSNDGNPRLDLVKDFYEVSVKEHSDARENFSGLDAKAQNTAAIAGVFLAGSLSLFNNSSFQKLLASQSTFMEWLLFGIAGLLMLATIFCLFAMKIREIPIGDVSILESEIKDILKQPDDEIPQLYENYVLRKITQWNLASSGLRALNLKKSYWVKYGQMLLGAAVVAVAILFAYTVKLAPSFLTASN